MSWRELVKETWEMFPIIVLLLVGGAIAIQSGQAQFGEHADRGRWLRNLCNVMFRLVGYTAVLLVIQHFIGLRPSLGW